MLRRPAQGALVLTLAGFALINAANALHKGGDFDVFVSAGDRVRQAAPLYADSSPGYGVIGPPFQAVLFAPFAALAGVSPTGARLTWYLVNLVSLIAGVWCWATVAAGPGVRDGPGVWSRWEVVAALAAVALPLQTNFEHQNMNALLLGITGLGAYAWHRDRSVTAAVLFGTAAALKAFPAVLLLVFVIRRQWRFAAVGAIALCVLTLTPAVWYGWTGAIDQLRAWTMLNVEGGWPTRPQNQSVLAMATRVSPAHATTIGFIVMAGLLAALVSSVVSGRGHQMPQAAAYAMALAVGVLLSPIAWDHYWVLMFPAFVVAALDVRSGRTDSSTWRLAVFCVAAVLVSGLSRATVGIHGLTIVRMWSASTVAGLVLVGALAMLRRREREEELEMAG